MRYMEGARITAGQNVKVIYLNIVCHLTGCDPYCCQLCCQCHLLIQHRVYLLLHDLLLHIVQLFGHQIGLRHWSCSCCCVSHLRTHIRSHCHNHYLCWLSRPNLKNCHGNFCQYSTRSHHRRCLPNPPRPNQKLSPGLYPPPTQFPVLS